MSRNCWRFADRFAMSLLSCTKSLNRECALMIEQIEQIGFLCFLKMVVAKKASLFLSIVFKNCLLHSWIIQAGCRHLKRKTFLSRITHSKLEQVFKQVAKHPVDNINLIFTEYYSVVIIWLDNAHSDNDSTTKMTLSSLDSKV